MGLAWFCNQIYVLMCIYIIKSYSWPWHGGAWFAYDRGSSNCSDECINPSARMHDGPHTASMGGQRINSISARQTQHVRTPNTHTPHHAPHTTHYLCRLELISLADAAAPSRSDGPGSTCLLSFIFGHNYLQAYPHIIN